MRLKRASTRSITHGTVGSKHPDLMALGVQFDDLQKQFLKQQKEQESYVRKIEGSIESKRNFLKLVETKMTPDSIAAANSVLEQAEAMLKVEQKELADTIAQLEETEVYSNRVKRVISRIEVERFRENTQRAINNSSMDKKSLEKRATTAPLMLDSETSIEKDIRLLTHQITAFIEISGK